MSSDKQRSRRRRLAFFGRAGRARGRFGGYRVPLSLVLDPPDRSQEHHPLFRTNMVLEAGLRERWSPITKYMVRRHIGKPPKNATFSRRPC